ncbi:MAG: DUF6436 domain-containing protein [Corticimicrobacter sp.]|uniref:DUF6436 domain-containing protein n=1 Tax=Corticimicrobacter sp. TaxID=2678536 RepID=UPI0032D9B359
MQHNRITPSRRALVIAIVVVVIVLTASSLFLWKRTGVSNLREFSTEQVVIFEGEGLSLPAAISGPGNIRIVHFWDPGCRSCNKETDAHLNYLIGMYRSAGIDFYSVQKPGTTGELAPFLQGKLTPLETIQGIETLPASPAMAIWDRDGNLAYAGPYSEGLICNSSNSFVEPIIDALIAGRKVTPKGFLAVGCYCPWGEGRMVGS